ncbi:MAG: C4-type zinc ribbon domain-containing protein [Oligoflexia bacterium]|nr:C4-type zinc ribbon domain-containing protein [Oligoflexia bacterium]
MLIREELEKLSRLQELDLKIDRARKLVSSAPSAFAKVEDEIKTQTSALTAAQNLKADLERQKRSLESEITMDGDRIKNIESRLSGVTNNKEFHAASKESDKAKKMISDRQKTVGELAEKITSQDTLLAEIQARLDDLAKVLVDKKSEVGSQVGEADKEIAAYAGDRNSMVAGINPPLISRYNRIRAVYSDAIVTVNSGHCTSCNVALPPQMYIRVQKGEDLITCPNCQRLLYYKIQ